MINKNQDIRKEIDFFNSLDMDNYLSFPPDKKTFDLIYQELKKVHLSGKGLEAGCGMASLGKKIIELNNKVSFTGVDINDNFVKKVNRNKFKNYQAVIGNIEERKTFKPKSFNFIIFPYVIHHIPNTKRLLENAYYWLKKDGFVIIFDPNASNLILKISYALRMLSKKLSPGFIKHCASDNEKNVSINHLLTLFIGTFKPIIVKTYLIKINSKNNLPVIIRILGLFRSLFLDLYNILPLSKFSGSDIIVIARKIN